jgi:leader peptidase (prepilin peptidase) / N-methyltransferase
VTSAALLICLTLGASVSTAAIWLLIVPRLREPTTDEIKIVYGRLASAPLALVVAGFSAAATWTALTSAPVSAWPPWLVLSTLGIVLASIDGYTTWMPAGLTRWAWVAMVAAGMAMPLLGGSWTDTIRLVAGAVGAGLLYGLLWALTRGGFGFGDVRFAPLIAGPASAVSLDLLLATLLVGSLLATAHGLWHHLSHRPGLQPWAPALTIGACLTLLLLQ